MIKNFNEYLNEEKIPDILLKAFQDLSYYIGGLEMLEKESNKKSVIAQIRDWGNWEHDYEDYERDEDDYEDDDFMILSSFSRKKLVEIIKKVLAENKKVKITYQTGEKNWIYFNITKK